MTNNTSDNTRNSILVCSDTFKSFNFLYHFNYPSFTVQLIVTCLWKFAGGQVKRLSEIKAEKKHQQNADALSLLYVSQYIKRLLTF